MRIPKRAPTVFLSSTAHDLRDIRRSLVSDITRFYGLNVEESEDQDFPIDFNAHSYQICLNRVRQADLVIALIGARAGGIFESEAGKLISITRKEIRVAYEAQIPIITYARQAIVDERHSFKQFVRSTRSSRSGVTDGELFAEFKVRRGGALADSHLVYDLIDEITGYKTSNWVFQFRDTLDISKSLEVQLPRFLAHHYHDSSMLMLHDGLIPDSIRDLIATSGAFRDVNTSIAELYRLITRYGSIFAPRAMIDLHTLKQQNFSMLCSNLFGRFDVLRGGAEHVRIAAIDSSMEFITADVWRTATYHRMIVERTAQVARKYGLKNAKHVRMLILFNPSRVLQDVEFATSLAYVQAIHRALQIRLGVCLFDRLPNSVGPRWLDFYLLPEKVVGISDPICGLQFEIDRQQNREVVRYYTNLYLDIESCCTNNRGGFWVEPTMTTQELLLAITHLVSG